jgi:hypothetical protein
MVAAAVLLLVSLFLVWSHQLSPAIVRRYGATGTFDGVPRTPDAWQLYTAADVLLALVAAALVVAATWGDRTLRRVLVAAVAVAIAFVAHAIAVPPTNGANVFDPRTGAYVATAASSGAGETLALAALAVAAAALLLSLTTDR